jgi:hypothetical protein
LIERQCPRERRFERLPVQVLHDEEIRPVLLPDVEERADVRMRERRDSSRFAFEPLTRCGIVGQVGWQDLESDRAV